MKKLTTFIICVFFVQCIMAQINSGGSPLAFGTSLPTPPEVVMPAVDVERYMLEDERNTDAKRPFRFGAELDTNLTLDNSGLWRQLPGGDRVWQIQITCRGAKSLNFIFNRFNMPQGGRMFIYTPDRKYVTGAYTERNNNPERVFSTSLYPGGTVIMEYYEPAAVRGMGEIDVSTVVHGYRDIFFKTDKGPYGTSGSCNININCAEGASWQMEKRGVALILRGGNAHCTGSLINNTSNDGTPYFLTANHCVEYYSPSTFVFVFKHEASNCNGTTGPTIYALNYATLIASGSSSDFALLRLNDTVPVSYDPLYLGWSRSNVAPTSMAGIHHPSGDLKKISLAGAGVSRAYDDISSDDGTHWGVRQWLSGTTEGGSSGSPLFDQNHLIIGQLHGGEASCYNTSGPDFYGKLAYSWTNNNASSSSARLKDWLDPTNTGATTCPAYDPCTSSLNRDALIVNSGTDTAYCNASSMDAEITVLNRGNDTLRTLSIKYRLDNGTVQQHSWSGSLILNASQTVTLSGIGITPGSHLLTIWSELPNGLADQNTSNDTIQIPIVVNTGTEVSYSIRLPERYSGYIDWIASYVSWNFVRDDGAVMAQHNSLDEVEISESFCSQPGCYTLRLSVSSYMSRLLSEITLEGFVNGNLVRTVTGSDSLRFCTTDVSMDIAGNDIFVLYPNPLPSGSRFVMDFAQALPRTYSVVDAQGTEVAKGVANEKHNEMALPKLAAGIYFVRVADGNGTLVRKLIMQ